MLLFDCVKNNAKIEKIMSVIMLVAVTFIACNMETVVKKKPQETTAVESNGCSVVIDPGHGGKDPGKVGVSGALEKEINLSISAKLKEILEDRGYKVVMTRTADTNLGEGKFTKIGDLNKRCEIINNTYAQNNKCIMISVHQNSFTQRSVHGAQCFFYQRSEQSMRLATICQNQLNLQINQSQKKEKANDSYYMLINSKCPGIIVECGFLSNADEEQKLQSDEYQKEFAGVLAEAIDIYFKGM